MVNPTGVTVKQMLDWLSTFPQDQEVDFWLAGHDRLEDVRLIREPASLDPDSVDCPWVVLDFSDPDTPDPSDLW